MDTAGEKKKRTSKKNADGRSTSSDDIKRLRKMEEWRLVPEDGDSCYKTERTDGQAGVRIDIDNFSYYFMYFYYYVVRSLVSLFLLLHKLRSVYSYVIGLFCVLIFL
jgi:hypothetical protein